MASIAGSIWRNLGNAAQTIFPVCQLGEGFTNLYKIYRRWTHPQPESKGGLSHQMTLVLESILNCSNIAHSGISLRSLYSGQLISTRFAVLIQGQLQAIKFLEGESPNLIADGCLNSLISIMPDVVKIYPENVIAKLAHATVQQWSSFVHQRKGQIEAEAKHIFRANLLQASRKLAALQLFSLMIRSILFFKENGLSTRISKPVIFELLDYSSSALSNCLTIVDKSLDQQNLTPSRTLSFLPFQIFKQMIHAVPLAVKAARAIERMPKIDKVTIDFMQLSIYLRDAQPAQPLRKGDFVLIKYTLPLLPTDPSLQYFQIPERYYGLDCFKPWQCGLRLRPVTQALIIVHLEKVYLFEKAALVADIFARDDHERWHIPNTQIPFTADDLYVDPAFDQRLSQALYTVMHNHLQRLV